MKSELNQPSSRVRAVLQELAGIGLPGLLAAGLFFVLPRESRSQGDQVGVKERAETAPLCGEWHRGAGESRALDLGGVKRAYLAIKSRVTEALDRNASQAVAELDRPYDAGLPACRGDATRTEPLDPAKGARFKGKVLYFVRASDLDRLEFPAEIHENPHLEILIVRTRTLKDLPEIARRLGRPVSLASAEFPKALGVRCSNTWLKITEKGDGIELHETR